MDRSKLVAALDEAISKDRSPAEKIFLKLTKQVWQADWTVAPYDIFRRMVEYDIPYFMMFMNMDFGDEEEEKQLIINWVHSMEEFHTMDKERMMALIDEINQLRATTAGL